MLELCSGWAILGLFHLYKYNSNSLQTTLTMNFLLTWTSIRATKAAQFCEQSFGPYYFGTLGNSSSFILEVKVSYWKIVITHICCYNSGFGLDLSTRLELEGLNALLLSTLVRGGTSLGSGSEKPGPGCEKLDQAFFLGLKIKIGLKLSKTYENKPGMPKLIFLLL